MKLLCCLSSGTKNKNPKEQETPDNIWENEEKSAIKPVAPGMMVTRPTKIDAKGNIRNKIKILQ